MVYCVFMIGKHHHLGLQEGVGKEISISNRKGQIDQQAIDQGCGLKSCLVGIFVIEGMS